MRNPYYNPSQHDLPAQWFVIDARDQILGKVATKAASLVAGKTDVGYVPHLDNGHRVVIINAAHLQVTDKRLGSKLYHRHTGYPGGIRTMTMGELYAKRPEDVIRRAIKGMLPKNRLGADALRKVYIYADEEHGQNAQKPVAIAVA